MTHDYDDYDTHDYNHDYDSPRSQNGLQKKVPVNPRTRGCAMGAAPLASFWSTFGAGFVSLRAPLRFGFRGVLGRQYVF